MDKLIDHLFSLGIPGFFLALALLYELAISLKLKFGRSWLYKEIRENLQNPAARKLLLHDLRARPNDSNHRYVSFLLNSHNWLNHYLDSTINFTERTLPWWQQKISLRTGRQYLTGRSLVLCFAIATLYPLILFLIRFAVSGNVELVEQPFTLPSALASWLPLFIFLISITLLSVAFLDSIPIKIILAREYKISIDAISVLLFVASMIALLFSLYYSEIILNNTSLTISQIFTIVFTCFCVLSIAHNKSLSYSLLPSFIFALTFVSAFIVIDWLIHSIIFASSAQVITLLPNFILAFFISGFSFYLIVETYNNKSKYTNIIINAISLIGITILLLTYYFLYFAPASTSSTTTNFISSNPLINELAVFLLLVIALPPINGILDWLSLALSRYCFDRVLSHSRWTQWLYILLDLLGAIVTLFLLYTLIFWVLGRFELLFPHSVGDVAAMRELWVRSPWHPDVLWITIMGATTMLMTLLHIVTSIIGLFFWLPQDLSQRLHYAKLLDEEAKRVPILPGEKYPASELHHQIAHFLTIGRDRTIVWGFCIGAAMLSWIINLFYPHIPFLSASSAPLIEMPAGMAIDLMLP